MCPRKEKEAEILKGSTPILGGTTWGGPGNSRETISHDAMARPGTRFR